MIAAGRTETHCLLTCPATARSRGRAAAGSLPRSVRGSGSGRQRAQPGFGSCRLPLPTAAVGCSGGTGCEQLAATCASAITATSYALPLPKAELESLDTWSVTNPWAEQAPEEACLSSSSRHGVRLPGRAVFWGAASLPGPAPCTAHTAAPTCRENAALSCCTRSITPARRCCLPLNAI